MTARAESPLPEASLSAGATEALANLLRSAGAEVDVKGNTLSAQGQTLTIEAVVERTEKRGDKWVSGVRFDVALEGEPMPLFTTGTVGLGDSVAEARGTTIDEWLMSFGLALVRALSASADDVWDHLDGFVLCPGVLGIRGQTSVEWSEDHVRMVLKSLKPALQEQPWFASSEGAHSITLQILLEPSGAKAGECRIDGEDSARLLEQALAFGWPKGSHCIWKLFCILKPGPAA